MSRLAQLNLLLFALLIAHTVDHAVNQPTRDLPATGTAAGLIGFLIVAGSTVLALRRSPLAPAASVFAGATTALGVIAIHLLPSWYGAVSDPYWDFDPNFVSWVLVLAPLAAGVVLAVAGARRVASGDVTWRA